MGSLQRQAKKRALQQIAEDRATKREQERMRSGGAGAPAASPPVPTTQVCWNVTITVADEADFRYQPPAPAMHGASESWIQVSAQTFETSGKLAFTRPSDTAAIWQCSQKAVPGGNHIGCCLRFCED